VAEGLRPDFNTKYNGGACQADPQRERPAAVANALLPDECSLCSVVHKQRGVGEADGSSLLSVGQ
jgi:hypothetical protein